MGRPKKNKRKHPSNSKFNKHNQKHFHKNKRQKKERFWIEDCEETTAPEGYSQMEVLITRVELTDDYTQKPKAPIDKKAQGDANDEAEEKTSDEKEIDASPPSPDKSVSANREEKVDHGDKEDTFPLSNKKGDSKEDEPGAPSLDEKVLDEDESDGKRQPVSALGEAKAVIEDLMDASTPFICVKKSKNVKKPVKRVSPRSLSYNPLEYVYV